MKKKNLNFDCWILFRKSFQLLWEDLSFIELFKLWCLYELEQLIKTINDQRIKEILDIDSYVVAELIGKQEDYCVMDSLERSFLSSSKYKLRTNWKQVFGFNIWRNPTVFLRKNNDPSVQFQVGYFLKKVFREENRNTFNLTITQKQIDLWLEIEEMIRRGIYDWNNEELWENSFKSDLEGFLKENKRLY